jgi:hypothetical protein
MLQKILKPPITRMNTDTKKLARKAFAARMGQDKAKTLQASLIDFRFFLPIPASWDHPRNPWLVFSNCGRELLIIKFQYVACI